MIKIVLTYSFYSSLKTYCVFLGRWDPSYDLPSDTTDPGPWERPDWPCREIQTPQAAAWLGVTMKRWNYQLKRHIYIYTYYCIHIYIYILLCVYIYLQILYKCIYHICVCVYYICSPPPHDPRFGFLFAFSGNRLSGLNMRVLHVPQQKNTRKTSVLQNKIGTGLYWRCIESIVI